ncbi:MAG TPA: MarR family transcriptional regulator [Pseudolysinimonas sp.]|nr:MarR family transcriptional regulator [Pseudolysinimonas sp.]
MTSDASETPDEAPPRLPGLIFDAERRFHIHAAALLQEQGLTLTEWTALAIIWEDGQPRSSADLARKAYVSAQAMGQVLTTLEERSLIQRTPDPSHGRRLLVELTQEGLDLVDRCQEVLRVAEKRFLEPLSRREKEFFLSLLEACVTDAAGQHLTDDPAV